MTVPPPPPDRTAFNTRSPPAPGRGFAIGVAVAGAAAIVTRGYLMPMSGGMTFGDGLLVPAAGVMAIAALGGLAGGWWSWRMFTRGLPVSLPRALAVAAATTVLSMLIGCIVGGLVVGVAGLVGALTTSKGEGLIVAVGALLGAVFVAPIFVLWLFGPTFAGLVLAWTLAWRYRVNRQGSV